VAKPAASALLSLVACNTATMLAAMTANSMAFQNELRDGIAGLVMLQDSEPIPVSSGLQ